MLDSRFDPAANIYDIIRDLKKVREQFAQDASGLPDCLSTYVRDTLQHQISVLKGVGDTINTLSNMMHAAENGHLVIMDGGDENRGYHRQIKVDLTSEKFRDGLDKPR